MAPAMMTETVDPTSALPLMTGVLSLVSAAEVMAGPDGAWVSKVRERLLTEPLVLKLPGPSEKVPLATVMEAVPALVLANGVKVAVRESPSPLMAESVPPVTETSLLEKKVPRSSEKVKVMAAISPLIKVDRSLVIARVGAWVSKNRERLSTEPTVLKLPAPSEKVSLATVMKAVLALVFGVGVKVAVRVGPEPVMVESVPPETVTSLLEKVVSGSSEKVKVMVAVSPLSTGDRFVLMIRVGAWVSKGRDNVFPAAPRLPAGSV